MAATTQQVQRTLIRSSIGVANISKSVNSFNKSLDSAQKSTLKTNKRLTLANRERRQALSFDKTNFQKRREAVRRREREDIVEASGIGGAIKRQGKVISNSTKGFLGRIIDFVGTLMVGWLLINLPTIIKLGEQLIRRIVSLVGVLRGFVSGLTTSLSGFGTLITGAFRSLITFDFDSQNQQIQNGLNQIQTGFLGMERSFDIAINLLSQPLNLGFDQLDIDETGQPAAPPDVEPGLPGTGLPDPKSAEMYRIAAALATEGSGPQSTVDMMQVVVNRKASGRYGATYTDILSAGTGGKNVAFEGVWKRPGGPKAFRQIQTLEDAAKWSGQSKATLLRIISDIQNPTLQANSAKFVGGAFDFRASPQNNPNGRLPGTAWRGGAGDNQFLTDPNRGDPIRKEGPAPFNLPAAVPPSPAVTGRSSVVDTVNIAAGGTKTVNLTEKGGLYGAPRRGGRSHAGIDINTGGQTGWYVGFKASGTVIFAGVFGGYGNLVIIKSGNTDYYFAHLARIMVQKGRAYNGEVIGEIGNTGVSSGIHLHYEVRPNGRPINPKPYLNLLDIGRKTGAAAAVQRGTQISAAQVQGLTAEQKQQQEQQLAQERRGQTIFIPLPSQQPQQQISMGGGESGGLNIMGSDEIPLNRMIAQKLLLDLAYT